MIYADENVWLTVVSGLRRRGWNVTAARDVGMLGRRISGTRGLILLTSHPGIIYASQYRRTVGELVRTIDTTLRRNRDRDVTNVVLHA